MTTNQLEVKLIKVLENVLTIAIHLFFNGRARSK